MAKGERYKSRTVEFGNKATQYERKLTMKDLLIYMIGVAIMANIGFFDTYLALMQR